jgi:hypothetical protein
LATMNELDLLERPEYDELKNLIENKWKKLVQTISLHNLMKAENTYTPRGLVIELSVKQDQVVNLILL